MITTRWNWRALCRHRGIMNGSFPAYRLSTKYAHRSYTPFPGLIKIGRTVYHAIAGKKCMGTTSPGKNSGCLISNGRLTEMGNATLANESTLKIRLKTNSPRFGSQRFNNQKPAPTKRQPIRFAPVRLPILISLEKSAPKAKK
jgi:hypothetical protein